MEKLACEFCGKKFIKVGIIEEKVGYKMRVTRAQLDDKDYFEKKLEMECYEGELIIQILERETLTHSALCDQMRIFLNET